MQDDALILKDLQDSLRNTKAILSHSHLILSLLSGALREMYQGHINASTAGMLVAADRIDEMAPLVREFERLEDKYLDQHPKS